MAPKGKLVEWQYAVPIGGPRLTHEITASLAKTGGYAIIETPTGLVLERKYFPTWRILLLGLPAVIFGRKKEVASVHIDALTPASSRVAVSGRLARWMRGDLERTLDALGAEPLDSAPGGR